MAEDRTEDPKMAELAEAAKDVDKMAKDMGIQMKNLHAVKITIETAEGQKIVLDPISCNASVMKGFEEYGINFQIQGKVVEGEIKF